MSNLRVRLKQNRIIRYIVYQYRAFGENHSFIHGHNNSIKVRGIRVKSVFQIKGDNNLIEVKSGAVIKKCKLFIRGNNNRVLLDFNAILDGTTIHIEDNGCTVEIGESTYIGPSHLACTEDGRAITIGKQCMLSSNIQIRTGDSHSILDSSGIRINPAKNVIIGDHCWIAEGAKIMKGVHLQNDIIVASGSIVTKSFQPNLLLGGNPARVLKENVNWDAQRL